MNKDILIRTGKKIMKLETVGAVQARALLPTSGTLKPPCDELTP